MNISELLETLDNNLTSELRFLLPGGREIKGDIHITEIKNLTIESLDCGENIDSYNEVIIQLWVNEYKGKDSTWPAGKAIHIINKAGSRQYKKLQGEVFIEYGDSKTQTAKYSIRSILEDNDELIFDLYVKPTECKVKRTLGFACC